MPEIFAGGRQQRAVHALVLQTQHDDDVAIANAAGKIVEHAHAHLPDGRGQQGLRPHGADFASPQRGERVDVGTGDARMLDVADDGHRQTGKILLEVADGVHVEQALGRVRVASVTGVDHMHVFSSGTAQVFGDEIGRARRGVPHHESVGVHRHQIVDGVEQGFALGRRGAPDVEIDDVGGQPLGGDLEGRARARGVLEEQIEHALAAQEGHFFHVPVGDFQKGGGRVQDVREHLARQAIDRQQVMQFALGAKLRIRHDR